MSQGEIGAASTAADNGKVVFVPELANQDAPTATELNAATAVDITHLLQGYTHDTSAESLSLTRFLLGNSLSLEGTITDTVSLTFPYKNDLTDTISTKLPKGQTGYIVERWAVPNEQEFAAGDILQSVIPITAGTPLPNIPADNDPEFTRTQVLHVAGKVGRDIAVVAG